MEVSYVAVAAGTLTGPAFYSASLAGSPAPLAVPVVIPGASLHEFSTGLGTVKPVFHLARMVGHAMGTEAFTLLVLEPQPMALVLLNVLCRTIPQSHEFRTVPS